MTKLLIFATLTAVIVTGLIYRPNDEVIVVQAEDKFMQVSQVEVNEPDTVSQISPMFNQHKEETEEKQVTEPEKPQPIKEENILQENIVQEKLPHNEKEEVIVTPSNLYEFSSKKQIEAIEKVSKSHDIDSRYLLAICLSENCGQLDAVGDRGCSFGPFQINMCAGKGRWNLKHNSKKLLDCAKDFECSADWTAVNKIKKNCIIKNGKIKSYVGCLSKHQGSVPDGWYKDKIYKNAIKIGLPK